jgi:hypothetical protein
MVLGVHVGVIKKDEGNGHHFFMWQPKAPGPLFALSPGIVSVETSESWISSRVL